MASNSAPADLPAPNTLGNGGSNKATEETKVLSEKELERKRRKEEKDAKFKQKELEKKKKADAAAVAGPTISKTQEKQKKVKEERGHTEILPPYVENTPPGSKKILRSFEDPYYKAYDPKAVESAWYSWWEKKEFFVPKFTADGEAKPEGSFVIVEPPPNVTGRLHIGHALMNSLQDTMIRWNRMQGKTVLYLPGCDHAGISTQTVVEKDLWKREKKVRQDLGREKFVQRVWEWKEEYHQRINTILRNTGCSVDWTREAFTMDKNLSAAVTETFVRLHEEGMIYRDKKLVNWCTQLNTAISGEEIDTKELEGPTMLEIPGYERTVEFGVIVHFKYQIEGSDEFIEVATTRLETMLGDTGVAVHPKDERYTHLVGRAVRHPFIIGRKMPIVADDYVDPNFGTGAVKMTPAHDMNDFALGKRHNLEFINIMNDDGTLNENAGPYEGKKRFDVRRIVQEDLEKLGLFVDKKSNPMTVPLCDKTKDVLEPLLKPQWYMQMGELVDGALKVVESGEIQIKPAVHKKKLINWLEEKRDWCLSRQLWWGHQIPVYFAKIEGREDDDMDGKLWFAGRTQQEAQEKAEKALKGQKFQLVRDEDVLDTWFSSGLWPFSTLGWPNQTHDLEKLYPTSMLETGWDILTIWVARMIMLGVKLTGKVPFTEVFCHGLVRDSENRKMSKSLGNVVDPQDVINGIALEDLHAKLLQGNLNPKEVEKAKKYQKLAFKNGIPECGTDALRFGLVAYTGNNEDIAFDVNVLHSYRKFCNKIYQATKYVVGKLGEVHGFIPARTLKVSGRESLAEQWILSKFANTAQEINIALANREFARSTSIIYAYWYHLCDSYIENSKSIIQDGSEAEKISAINTLYTALEGALLMIHPFMPFITEELWQRLPRRPDDSTESIVIAKYPWYEGDIKEMHNQEAEEAYELVLDVSRGIRSLMGEYAIKEDGKVFIQTHNSTSHATIASQTQSINRLAGKGVSTISILDSNASRPAGCLASTVSTAATVFLYVKGRIDIDETIAIINKKAEKARGPAQKLKKQLEDPAYLQKASKEAQETETTKLAELEAQAKAYAETIAQFERLKLE